MTLHLRRGGTSVVLDLPDDRFPVVHHWGPDLGEVNGEDLADAGLADPWAEGDLSILADLGLSEQVMSVICDDSELWASEQLLRIAAELGFESELSAAADLDLD